MAARTAARPAASARTQDARPVVFGKAPPNREEEIRAGFGENTISIPGLAARAVGLNLREARKLVPTVGELLEQQQARAEERRAEARVNLETRREAIQENAPEPVIRVDFQRAEAQARAQTRQVANPSTPAVPEASSRIEFAPSSALDAREPLTPVAGPASSFAPAPAAQFDLRG